MIRFKVNGLDMSFFVMIEENFDGFHFEVRVKDGVVEGMEEEVVWLVKKQYIEKIFKILINQ